MNDPDDRRLLEFVRRHPRLFVLTGAGCSTASGLGDYRDAQGQWKRRQPITGQTFIGDETARKRYWARSYVGWPGFSRAQPGSAHRSLAALQQADRLEMLVTQNVDRLHQKAGHEEVLDLHGVLATVSCIQCAHSLSRDDYQQDLLACNPWLASLTAAHAPDGDADLEPGDLQQMQVPPCPRCGGLLKPDVVFFGENVPRMLVERAMNALAAARRPAGRRLLADGLLGVPVLSRGTGQWATHRADQRRTDTCRLPGQSKDRWRLRAAAANAGRAAHR